MRFKESKIHSVLGYMVSGGQATSEMSIKSDPVSNTAVIYFQMLAKCSRLHSIGSLIIV